MSISEDYSRKTRVARDKLRKFGRQIKKDNPEKRIQMRFLVYYYLNFNFYIYLLCNTGTKITLNVKHASFINFQKNFINLICQAHFCTSVYFHVKKKNDEIFFSGMTNFWSMVKCMFIMKKRERLFSSEGRGMEVTVVSGTVLTAWIQGTNQLVTGICLSSIIVQVESMSVKVGGL